MGRNPKSTDELWNTVSESSFEVLRESLKQIADKSSAPVQDMLRESQAVTCALQELKNREMGLKPATLSE